MAKAPAAWTRTPLQTLSTAPTRAPRLPADKGPVYRPKITQKPRRKVKPRRVPPRAPVTDRTSDRTSAAAVDRYKQSPRYVAALQAARVARIATAKASERRRGGDILHGFGLKRLSAKDELKERDFKALNTGGRDVPRTDAELRKFLKTGQKVTRKPGFVDRKRATSTKRASDLAPVIKLADYTLRLNYASAGASSALLRGKGPQDALKAAGRGFTGKERKTYSTVLKEHGIGGAKGSILGFGLDILGDPTSWVSFGASSAVRKAAVKAGENAAKQAEKAALESGAGKAQAKIRGVEARNQARAHALKEADLKAPPSAHRKGLTVKVGGKALPGVERATGAAGHRAQRAGQAAAQVVPERARVAGSKIRTFTREAGADVNANVRRVDPTTRRVQSTESQATEKALRRESRSEQQQTTRDVQDRLNAMRRFVSKGEMRGVIDAIEAGNLKPLRNAAPLRRRDVRRVRTRGLHKDPDRLVYAAQNIQADLKHLNRLGRQSGAISGRIGKKSRSLQEVRQADIDTGAVSSAKTRASLQEARQAQAQARVEARNLPATAKPSERQAARRKVRHTQDRVEFLRKRLVSQQRRQVDRQSASHVQAVGRTRRRTTEARGYFPRVLKSEIKSGGLLDRLSELRTGNDVPYAQVGANKPGVGAAKRREDRKTRAEYRANENTAHKADRLSEDIRPVLSQYAASVAKGSSASNLNTNLIQQLGRKIPTNPSKAQLAELQRRGQGFYRVRRGVLEELHPDVQQGLIVRGSGRKQPLGLKVPLDPKTKKPIKPQATGGQVAMLDKAQLARIRQREQRSDKKITQGYDSVLRGWKTAALSTVGYLTRNLVGDNYNAWTDESAWRLLRNQGRSAKVLGKQSEHERVLRRPTRGTQRDPDQIDRFISAAKTFRDRLPGDRHTVKLSEEQAAQIAKHLKVPADQVSRRMKAEVVAKLAEDMGVIRQGRFVELMEDTTVKPRAANAWKDVAKRVEDQTRLATFLGGLQRGMDPREAAGRASKIQFDYGDLTDIERGVFRRIAPFYTFPARNIPHQAKAAFQHPGKFPVVAKAVEEGRRAAGLGDDYTEGLSPYEQRQLGVPIKIGDKTYTISLGLPFTDLNDTIDVVSGVVSGAAKLAGLDIGGKGFTGAGAAALQRTAEAAAPFPKTGFELLANHSFFYRDQISPDKEPYTRAPQWAISAAKHSPQVKKALGLVDDYLPPDAPGKVWGWPRKMDYAFRQGQPGAINPLLDVIGLGTKGANARQMTKAQRLLAFAGLRAIKYQADPAKLNALYDRRERVQTELDKLGRRSGADPTLRGTSSNATAEGKRLSDELSAIETQIAALLPKTRPGGLIENQRVGVAPKGTGGLKIRSGPALKTTGGGALKVRQGPALKSR